MNQDLRRHMALVEQAIASAFVNDSLPVHLLGGTQGPHTLTFGLRLYQPTKANLAKALKLASAVEAAIGDSPVRIYSDSGVLFVEVPSPVPVIIYGRTLQGEQLAVPIGMTARRTVAGIDFDESPHVLLVGPTNAGKTTAARCIAYHLAKQNRHYACRFIVATFKPKDWKAFANLAHTFGLIVTPQETAQAITWLKAVMYNRTANEIDSPQVFFFLDDLLNLLGAADTDIAGDLRELASLGRAAGIHLIIGTQRLGEMGAGGAAITGNIRTRLVFGTADAGDAAQFTGRGESGAERLGRYKGDALLVTEGSTQRVAVAYVDDTDLASLRQNPDEWRPWLNTRTVQNGSGQGGENSPAEPQNSALAEPVPGGSNGGSTPEPPPVLNHSSLVLTGPARTGSERQAVQNIYARTGSKTQTCKLIWGRKNGDTWRWLHEALQTEVRQ